MATCEITFKSLLESQGGEVLEFCKKLEETLKPLLKDCKLTVEGPFLHSRNKPWVLIMRVDDQCAARTLSVLGRVSRNIEQWKDVVSHMSVRQ